MSKPIINPWIQSSCFLFCALLTSMSTEAQAQDITADGTTSTTVTSPDGNNFTIDGGDRPEGGNNLFHSFQDFSVPTGGSAAFNNAVDIQNIFSRVTGGNVSSINGLIKANGSANLFLINPAGIMFGAGARLDIGGSFLGSTADSILFPEGEFSAVDLDNPPLLTINAPIGLGFRDNPGAIVNQSVSEDVGLTVSRGESITLVGGDINLAGGRITAPGGRVELGGLSATGEIGINSDGSLNFPNEIERADITLTNQASVDVRAGGGGFINFNVRNLTLSEKSNLFAGIAEKMGSPDAQAGDITINATESVRLIGTGLDELRIATGIALLGRVTRSDLAELTGIISGTEDAGKEGDIIVSTPNLLLQNGAILVNTVLNSNNENTTIETSGNIIISDSQQVEISRSFLSTLANRNTERGAGDIIINTERLLVQEEGAIASSTFGNGKGGDININASESIEVKTTLTDAITPTVISSNSIFGQGKAGDINIYTGRLILQDGGRISSASGGQVPSGNQELRNILEPSEILEGSDGNLAFTKGGLGGNINIKADFIEITGGGVENQFPSALTSESTTPAKAGNINIDTNKLIISNGAEVRVGSISTGEGGNIDIQADSLILEKGASISAQATDNADGGNIDIDAEFIIAALNQNNDIIARAEGGQGGNINITTEGIFNLQERSSTPANETNDIDASSEFGLDGNVSINTPDTTALQESLEVPAIVELETLGVNACSGIDTIEEVSRFEVTGKGGVAPTPTKPLTADALVIEGKSSPLGTRQPESLQREEIKPIITAQGPIYPARGIIFKENGDIILTAYPTDNVQRLPQNSPNCHKS